MIRPFIVTLVLSSLLPNVSLAQRGTLPKPCELLTADLVKKINVASNKGATIPAPEVVKLGTQGSACSWGEIMMQVDAFTPTQVHQFLPKDPRSWEKVSGVGDAAYFHNVRDMMGELFVVVGKRTLAVMISIPEGTTAAAFKSNFVDVATAIVPKLK